MTVQEPAALTERERIARIIAGELLRQDHDDPDRLAPEWDLTWPYVDQGEVDFGKIADAILSPRGEGTEAVATFDSVEARAEAWSDRVEIQDMVEATTAVFANWSSPEILSRFRQQMMAVVQQAFIEGFDAAHPAGGEAPSVVDREVLDRVEGRASSLERIGATVDASDLRAILAALATLQADGGHGSLRAAPSVPTEQAEAPVVGWQPIETAPRDGTWIQVWRDPPRMTGPRWEPLVNARWDDEAEAWVWPDEKYEVFTVRGVELADMKIADCEFFEDDSFTHWMPLPPAPTDTTGEA